MAPSGAQGIDGRSVTIGGLTREELGERLRARGVLLNAHAETLLADDIFDVREGEGITVVVRSVAQLGFAEGASLSQILAAAPRQGLALCPADAGPYLRLAYGEQEGSADSVLSNGGVPDGALKVASAPVSDDDDYPKGFYLRVVDRVPWLRGYRCDDEYLFPPDAALIFAEA